jgi:hypothetical protein
MTYFSAPRPGRGAPEGQRDGNLIDDESAALEQKDTERQRGVVVALSLLQIYWEEMSQIEDMWKTREVT